jgi:hypothetical protein
MNGLVQVGQSFAFRVAADPPAAGGTAGGVASGTEKEMGLRQLAQAHAQAAAGNSAASLSGFEAALTVLMPVARRDNDAELTAEITKALDVMETLRATSAQPEPPVQVPVPPLVPEPEPAFPAPPPPVARGGGGGGAGRLQNAKNWRLVFRQSTAEGLWIDLAKTEWESVNTDAPESANFSILDQLESFRSRDGSFTFMLKWHGCAESKPQRWKQTSNPMQHVKTVEGYEAISAPYTANAWHGLAKGTNVALLDGSSNDCFYYAIGSSQRWNNGVPGPSAVAAVVELYGECQGEGEGEKQCPRKPCLNSWRASCGGW